MYCMYHNDKLKIEFNVVKLQAINVFFFCAVITV